MRTEKWVQSAIGALIDTAIITMFTGNWSWFLLLWITSIPPTRVISYYLFERKAEQNEKPENRQARVKPFAVSEYCARMEEAALDILESREPVDQTIILWWGLNGLRLNEDGSLEWISRRKNKTLPSNGLNPYEGEMEKLRELYRVASQINAPGAMQTIMSQMQTVQNAAIISQIRPSLMQCCIQYPGQYPLYYYGGCCRLN